MNPQIQKAALARATTKPKMNLPPGDPSQIIDKRAQPFVGGNNPKEHMGVNSQDKQRTSNLRANSRPVSGYDDSGNETVGINQADNTAGSRSVMQKMAKASANRNTAVGRVGKRA